MIPPGLPGAIELRAPGPFDETFMPPGSKSLTNRALLAAAVARGSSTLSGVLVAEDTVVMQRCLEPFGVRIEGAFDVLTVSGSGGPLRASEPFEVDVATAGTVARFLTAILAGSPVSGRVDGSPRMRERPMETLIVALRAQGASITCLEREGFLPIRLAAGAGLRGGVIVLERPASSQFVSALLFAGCLARSPLEIRLSEGSPARPYIDMTLEVLRAFGIDAGGDGTDRLTVTPGVPVAAPFAIEPDASSASYFLALAAIHGGRARIEGLGSASLQGDAGFCRILERMGARCEQTAHETVVAAEKPLVGGVFDLSSMPDMTLGLAVTAIFARGTTEISGVGILRHHESDRLAALATELRKLGARVEEAPDGLHIEPPVGGPARGVTVDTYKDHRMAMALSLVGEVTIRDPACVAKTYPTYFNELRRLGMVVESASAPIP